MVPLTPRDIWPELDGGMPPLAELFGPRRIQRRRTKGWRMPEGAVYVGRPTIYGNAHRFNPKSDTSRRVAVQRFRRDWERVGAHYLAPLRGHDLACWCPLDQPCHADVLLALANR